MMHLAPITIVARIVDIGELHRQVEASDHVRVVIRLADHFATVIERPSPRMNPSAQGQVLACAWR